MISRDTDLFEIQSRLLNWLQTKMPDARDLKVSELLQSGAGFTSESFLFDLTWKEADQNRSAGMVLRCEGTQYPVYPDPKVKKQFCILKQLEATDIPVPKVFWFEEDATLLGTPFYVMGKLDGIVPSEFPPYHSYGICYEVTIEQRERMWWEVITAVARLHRLDWQSKDLAFLGIPPAGRGSVDQDLSYWENYLVWLKDSPEDSHPILEAALKWLRDNRYQPEHVSLCWGDARLPNAIFSPDGTLLGLLDWDIAFLGDGESDLAFILTLDHLLGEAIGVPRLEGLPDKGETVRRYEELAGKEVKHLFYNEVRAAFVAGLHIVKVQRNLRHLGVSLPGEDPDRDNFCTQHLARLLGLPSPSNTSGRISGIESLVATVQFNLTGTDGGYWYIVCDCGNISRHEGIARKADTVVTLPADTWTAIQRGQISQFHAWTSGEMQIEGDHTVLHLLEGLIAQF